MKIISTKKLRLRKIGVLSAAVSHAKRPDYCDFSAHFIDGGPDLQLEVDFLYFFFQNSRFRSNGVEAATLNGQTPQQEKQETIHKAVSGSLRCVSFLIVVHFL